MGERDRETKTSALLTAMSHGFSLLGATAAGMRTRPVVFSANLLGDVSVTTERPEDFVFEVRAGCGKDRLKEGGRDESNTHSRRVCFSCEAFSGGCNIALKTTVCFRCARG